MDNRTIYPWEAPAAQYGANQNTALSPPYLIARVFEGNQITLLWGEASQAEGYLIHRGENPQHLKPIATAQQTTYIDTTAQTGQTYYYTVRSYNEYGQSYPTDIASVTMPERPNAPPQELQSDEDDAPVGKRLRVQRKQLEKCDAPPLESEIYQGQPHQRQQAQQAYQAQQMRQAHQDQQAAQQLQQAQQEYQTQQAQQQAQQEYQTQQQAEPPAPTNLRAATQGTKLVSLAWQAPLQGLSYRLYRSQTPWSGYGLVAETDQPQYTDTVPEAATKYYYFVQSVYEGRASQASPMIDALTFPALPPPEVPQNLRANPYGHEAIELRWAPARAAAAYVVYARQSQNEDFCIIGHTLDCGWLHEGLAPESVVEYRVQAYHDTGASELSGVCANRSGQPRQQAPPRRPTAPANPPPAARRFPAFSLNAFQRGMGT